MKMAKHNFTWHMFDVHTIYKSFVYPLHDSMRLFYIVECVCLKQN
jgi:hypothetical protein